MKKYIVTIISIIFVSCSALPQQAEIDYRNRLENEILNTFPDKLTIIIHPFVDLTKRTNDDYLATAIPDTIESMLEPMRSSLAYIPFDGVPFYISDTLSNLFQEQAGNLTNTNADGVVTNTNNSYFSYLTNYLTRKPIQVTQLVYKIETNTNYYKVDTNVNFQLGKPVTNFISNNILITKTNETNTNLVTEYRNYISTTNLLLLIKEEFPHLIEYLSYIPIDIRRASKADLDAYKEFEEWEKNPKAWNRKELKSLEEKIEADVKKYEKEMLDSASKELTEEEKKNIKERIAIYKEETEKKYTKQTQPDKKFSYTYHVTGDFKTARKSQFDKMNALVTVKISALESTGLKWWQLFKREDPPKLSKIEAEIAAMDTNDIESFKKKELRLPFVKKKITPRLKESFEEATTNAREERPVLPENYAKKDTGAYSFRFYAEEQDIAIKIFDQQKHFYARFINRPHTVLNVVTEPSETLVYLNGAYIGVSPLSYPTAPLGEQRISFLKEGFKKEELLVNIVAGKTNALEYTLEQENNTGILTVTSSMPDAEVYLDSSYQGKTPLVISNLTLGKNYRMEILNPEGDLLSNRNSVYKKIKLTEESPSMVFDAKFKTYETHYKTATQKVLLATTYLSWFATVGLLGTSIYTQARSHELRTLARLGSTPLDRRAELNREADQFAVASQVTLYTSLFGILISSGITGWYLHSKEVFLGFDYHPEEQGFFANLKLSF